MINSRITCSVFVHVNTQAHIQTKSTEKNKRAGFIMKFINKTSKKGTKVKRTYAESNMIEVTTVVIHFNVLSLYNVHNLIREKKSI